MLAAPTTEGPELWPQGSRRGGALTSKKERREWGGSEGGVMKR